MSDSPNAFPVPAVSRYVISEILLLVGFILLGNFAGSAIGLWLSGVFYGLDLSEIMSLVSDPAADARTTHALMLLQGISAVFTFILAAGLYIRFVEKRPLRSLSPNADFWLLPALLTSLLVLVFAVFNNGLLYGWNAGLDLPDWLSGVEDWMKNSEKSAEKLTRVLTRFNSPADMLAGVLVIGVIPAVGEELVFRGILQPKIHSLTRNVHTAVWLTAAIFSFIHFQFYGFLPRLALGVVFGYLYVWSGSIFYPMLAHFTNNGFSVILVYLYQRQITQADPDRTDLVPPWAGLLSLVASMGILFLFKSFFAGKGWNVGKKRKSQPAG
jgi:uncharacterized protein